MEPAVWHHQRIGRFEMQLQETHQDQQPQHEAGQQVEQDQRMQAGRHRGDEEEEEEHGDVPLLALAAHAEQAHHQPEHQELHHRPRDVRRSHGAQPQQEERKVDQARDVHRPGRQAELGPLPGTRQKDSDRAQVEDQDRPADDAVGTRLVERERHRDQQREGTEQEPLLACERERCRLRFWTPAELRA